MIIDGKVTSMCLAPEGLHRVRIYRDSDWRAYAEVEPIHVLISAHYDDRNGGRTHLRPLSWGELSGGRDEDNDYGFLSQSVEKSREAAMTLASETVARILKVAPEVVCVCGTDDDVLTIGMPQLVA